MLHQTHEPYRYILELIGYPTKCEKCSELKIAHFEEKGLKVKSSTLKVETSWVKRIIKHILETRNAS